MLSCLRMVSLPFEKQSCGMGRIPSIHKEMWNRAHLQKHHYFLEESLGHGAARPAQEALLPGGGRRRRPSGGHGNATEAAKELMARAAGKKARGSGLPGERSDQVAGTGS